MICFIVSIRSEAVLKVSYFQAVEQNANIEFVGVKTDQILATLQCLNTDKNEDVETKQKHFCAC